MKRSLVGVLVAIAFAVASCGDGSSAGDSTSTTSEEAPSTTTATTTSEPPSTTSEPPPSTTDSVVPTTTTPPQPAVLAVVVTGATGLEGSGTVDREGTGFTLQGEGTLAEHDEYIGGDETFPVAVAADDGLFTLTGNCEVGSATELLYLSPTRNVLGYGPYVLSGTIDTCDPEPFALTATMADGSTLRVSA